MGTSTGYSGPKQRPWGQYRDRLRGLYTRLAKAGASGASGDGSGDIPAALLDAEAPRLADDLLDTLRRSPQRAALKQRLDQQARQVVDALEDLQLNGIEQALGAPRGTSPDERELWFVEAFAARADASGGTAIDVALRRAAVAAADDMLYRDPRLGEAVRSGSAHEYRISGDLLCWVYAAFFAHAVAGFLHMVVAEHLKAALPVLYLDPTGRIAGVLANKLVGLIPNPCEEQVNQLDRAVSLADTARRLIGPVTSQLLGDGDMGMEAA